MVAEDGSFYFINQKGSPTLFIDEFLALTIGYSSEKTIDLKNIVDTLVKDNKEKYLKDRDNFIPLGDFKDIDEIINYYFNEENIINNYNKSDLHW